MAKKHEFVRKNINVIRKLVKSGDISGKVITDFHIYGVYREYRNVPSKMQRYSNVATDLRINTQAVIRAVKSMESNV